eukprot:GHRR01024663.1.p1 GENE.GHRR01024663.1~~GHRR01024663.1.p1  ORF type:complete len:384 (+),score=128.00 GHRR01024663.1:63-1214(+)
MATASSSVAQLIPWELSHTLSSSYEFWQSLPFSYVFIGHCLFCALAAPELRDRFLVHYMLTFLWGNGGGITTALLLMAPQYAKLAFFASNEIMASWTVCWWLVNYFPGDVFRNLLKRWYIKVFAKSCTALLRALLIVQRVDLGCKLYPGVAAAPLLLGTLAGCGGRLIADAMLYGWQAMPGSAELTSPGFVSRSAAMAAVTYHVLGHVLQLLPLSAAAGLVVTALMLHSFATEITGRPLDFTAPVADLLHILTRVPSPSTLATVVATSSQKAVTDASTKSRAQAKTPNKTPEKAATPSKTPPTKTKQSKVGASPSKGDTSAVPADNIAASVGLAEQQENNSSKAGSAAADKKTKANLVQTAADADGSLAITRQRRSTRRLTAA